MFSRKDLDTYRAKIFYTDSNSCDQLVKLVKELFCELEIIVTKNEEIAKAAAAESKRKIIEMLQERGHTEEYAVKLYEFIITNGYDKLVYKR